MKLKKKIVRPLCWSVSPTCAGRSRFHSEFTRHIDARIPLRKHLILPKTVVAESPANSQPMVKPSPQYLAQVKAFLSYIEEVEVDEETIEDILTGLEEEFDPPVASDGEQSGAELDTLNGNGADNDSGEGEDEFAQEGLVRRYTD